MPSTALCWIRRDLRLSDHTALAEATQFASQVAVVFVFDTTILRSLSDKDDRRVVFIHRSLQELDAKLRAHGSRLIVLNGDPTVEIPQLAAQLGVSTVFCARDFEPQAIARDEAVRRNLGEQGRELVECLDHLIQDPFALLNQSGEPFRVYTPYSRAWYSALQEDMLVERTPNLGHLWPAAQLPAETDWSLDRLGFLDNDLWLDSGEDAAQRQLANFLPKMAAYTDERDFPARPATSGLSVHLRFGTISPRELMRAARSQLGTLKWQNEIVWREFYAMILARFPHVVESTFQPAYRELRWPGEDEAFWAWAEGKTGYPLVDAAMRCLNATGWMHNRLRMVVASFLTKDLLVDYRRGEAYFARKLLDFELASNNGGWQWAASTGVDAQPYFRIFNPILQSRKFDPDGEFIRRWCPELRYFSNQDIHFPADTKLFAQLEAGCGIGTEYPAPIIDHAAQKERATRLLSLKG